MDLSGEGGLLVLEMTPAAEIQLQFLAHIQRILQEGSFVATYKFALIRVIADLSVEREPGPDGTLALQLGDIAERFIELYWRQAAPFRPRRTLVQATGGQAALLSRLLAVRERYGKLSELRRTPRWRSLVRGTKSLLLEQPLWRLQRVGDDLVECLYPNSLQDGAIVLKPGVADCFRAQFPVVQALVQLAWLRMVQALPMNRELIGQTGDVAEFLFGADRSAIGRLAGSLSEVQGGRCFYCSRRVPGGWHVDHFVPWVRYPRDLGHNFVLAHDKCNSRKADLLAGMPYLDRWLDRNVKHGGELGRIFAEARILHDADTSRHVAAWAYEQVERTGGVVWMGGAETARLGREWRARFA